MAEPGSTPPFERRPGLREALLVGALVVGAVLLASWVTFLVPRSAGDVVFRTPLLIVVLIGGTAFVLWRITRPSRPGPPGPPSSPGPSGPSGPSGP